MGKETVLLREFLFVEPLLNFQLIGGKITGEARISEIAQYSTEGNNENLEVINHALVVIDMDTLSEADIVTGTREVLQLAKQREAGITTVCLVKKEPLVLPKEIYDAIKDTKTLVICFENLTYDQLVDHFQFVQQLAKSNRLFQYIRSTNASLYTILNKQGIDYLWSFIESTILQPLFLFNIKLEPLALSESMTQKIIHRKGEWEKLRAAYHNYRGSRSDCMTLTTDGADGQKKWYLLKLNAGIQLGYIGIAEDSGQVQEIDVAQVQRALPIIITELLKRREIVETEKSYKQNFLYDLLHNNLEEASDLIISHGKLWDWDLVKPYQLLLVKFHKQKTNKFSHEEFQHIQLLIKNTLSSEFKTAIVEELNGQIVVMYKEDSKEERKGRKETKDHIDRKEHKERKANVKVIATKIRQSIIGLFTDSSVTIGIGRFYPTTGDLCRAYQEAKTALELNKHMADSHIMHFEDLGVMRLLTNIRDEQLEDFFKEYLQELLLFDQENNTNLLQTLQVYFAENGNLKSTSKKMFIHTNTLRYRLKKAEEILGVNLQNPGDFVNLYVASLIHGLHK